LSLSKPLSRWLSLSEPSEGLDIGQEAVRVFDCVRYEAEEAGGGAAVAHAVVEGERQLGDLADSQLSVHHPRLVDDPADAEDGHLRWLMIAAEPSTPNTP
jgi:hypothetical protein